MMEILIPHQENISTKNRITIDLIKNGEEFLKKFDINEELVLDVVSMVYRYLSETRKIPHNLYKFFIAGYYIVSRHPITFPAHQTKIEFCEQFGIEQSALDYSVERLVSTLNLTKILDDSNFPYYFDPKCDMGFKLAKNHVRKKVEQQVMNFLLKNQNFNSQMLAESLVSELVYDMNVFPEELFRQYYELIFELVEENLQDQHYREVVQLQEKYFI
ncbi:MAG: hypothetical protein JW891_17650 [Candidatus Lokiarchaeota archaeon]|nr:hypothetical protein [Candidatus Lokiarchaeota archaeon]